MNVLSLFDGMSCGHLALDRMGVKVDNYYASEIDKYAIQITMANYPNTIQLGSVVNVDGTSLPKIDLLIGGSPCQSFSFAGRRKGMSTKDEQEILTLEHYLQLKEEGYEFEGQSYLFWEYMRILNEVKPTYFLLENVMMGEKWERVLSKAIGYNPIEINSALVSAQNRRRLYWTNIGMQPMGLFGDLESIIQQPKDKGIYLKDILQDNPNAKYYLTNKAVDRISRHNNDSIDNEKSNTIHAGYYKQGGRDQQYVCQPVDEKYYLSDKMLEGFIKHKERHDEKGTGFGFKPKEEDDKGNALRANGALCPTDTTIVVHNTQRRDPNRPSIQKNKNAGGSGPLSRTDGKTYALDTGNTNAVEILDCYNNNIRTDGKVGTITQHMSRSGMTNGFKLLLYDNNSKEQTDNTKTTESIPYLISNQGKTLDRETDKSHSLMARDYKGFGNQSMTGIVEVDKQSQTERLLERTGVDNSDVTEPTILDVYNRKLKEDGKCVTLTDPCHNNIRLVEPREVKQLSTNNKSNGGTQPYQQDRIYDIDGISPALSAGKSDLMITSGTWRTHKDGQGFREVHSEKGATIPARAREDGSGQNVVMIEDAVNKPRIRRLTPIECERLQTVPDNYTNVVSDTQRYKCLGNGWTIDVIAHIFSYLPPHLMMQD
jgi:DNA-cytosine methyltransferase